MGALIAQNGLTLVYGAGKAGMMGAVARGCLRAGGWVIGVTHEWETMHATHMDGLTQLEVMKSLPDRKARMIELADAFIILPGGIGTIDEFFEILAAAQIRLQAKPIAILNINGYYDGMLAWIDRAVRERFVSEKDTSLFFVENDPENLIKRLCYN
jgi:uncharacterized protein (TIGR00730 family)